MVADFFEIFGDSWSGIFFLQFFDDAVDQHGRGFLLEIAQFAGQFTRKRQRLAVHDGKFLAELFVLSLDIFRDGRFELAFVHHLGNVFDGHHLAFEHGKNFRQRHCAHLHVPQRELFACDSPREIIHQFFFARGKAIHDPALLPLERLAFETLAGCGGARKSMPACMSFLKDIGLAARQRQQARAVGDFEIVDVAAIRGRFGLRMELLDHVRDRAAAAGAGQSANEDVVARSGKLDAHFQCAQRALLADEILRARCACAVVSNGIRDGSQRQRNLSARSVPAMLLP